MRRSSTAVRQALTIDLRELHGSIGELTELGQQLQGPGAREFGAYLQMLREAFELTRRSAESAVQKYEELERRPVTRVIDLRPHLVRKRAT